MRTTQPTSAPPLGIGYYTAAEASRLLQVPRRNISRWLGGYAYTLRGNRVLMGPLWQPQLPPVDSRIELSFRDLIELRFVQAFLSVGVGLQAIRNCLEFARELTGETHPFSTRQFRTDGKTIFLESLDRNGEPELLDLKRKQYTIHRAIERTFKDLDIRDDVVARWRPYNGKASIVLDPERAFGQPIAAASGVPTVALADAARAEGSAARAAKLYEVQLTVVRDAVRFEQGLMAA